MRRYFFIAAMDDLLSGDDIFFLVITAATTIGHRKTSGRCDRRGAAVSRARRRHELHEDRAWQPQLPQAGGTVRASTP